jgi:hypothetical protein
MDKNRFQEKERVEWAISNRNELLQSLITNYMQNQAWLYQKWTIVCLHKQTIVQSCIANQQLSKLSNVNALISN